MDTDRRIYVKPHLGLVVPNSAEILSTVGIQMKKSYIFFEFIRVCISVENVLLPEPNLITASVVFSVVCYYHSDPTYKIKLIFYEKSVIKLGSKQVSTCTRLDH